MLGLKSKVHVEVPETCGFLKKKKKGQQGVITLAHRQY